VEGRPRDAGEARLVDLAQTGDTRAYEQLVEIHGGVAFRAAYLVTRSAADAEEAVQDAFVKAWRTLGRFRRGAPFRPWLLQIVVNEALNRRRSASRHARLAIRAAAEAPSGDAAPSPEATAIEHEALARLLREVEDLPGDARDVIVCRYFIGLSEDETAHALDVPVGTVKSRAARALDRLRGAYA
jgi:RNA polymerase sigma factor (sigma-70 family)